MIENGMGLLRVAWLCVFEFWGKRHGSLGGVC